MTQRITAQTIATDAVSRIDQELTNLDATQNQLSTGYAINQPSDNPFGEETALTLSGQLASYTGYNASINQAVAWMQTAGSALQSVSQIGQTVQELTLESANGTMNQNDLNSVAQEVLQYISQVKQTANTQYNGAYIFAGTDTTTQPYQPSQSAPDTYAGNQAQINYAVGPGSTLPINTDLYSVLGDGGSDGKLLSTMRSIANDLTGGNTADLQNQLASLKTNLSSLDALQAQVGASQARLSMASSRITSLQSADQSELASVEDTNMGQATITFSEQQAGYQAALQSTAKIIQTSLINFLQS